MQIISILVAKFRRFVMKPAVLAVIGVIILGLVIWFFGPIMGYGDFYPLETEFARIVTIASIAGLIVFILILRAVLRWRKEKKLDKAVVEGAGQVDPSDEAAKAEIAELQGRMKEALSILRKSRLGGKGGAKSLYQLPWYIMIGPPGAGKTTAIVNSGLKFPLAEKMGKAAIVGVGGTRNCDWWFTNEAVLIDTAGRYTTQESDAEADARSWTGFLDILKNSRSRQPINGAMVAISLSDLSLQDEPTRRAHALAIRTRLRELRDTLGVRFPVYVMFTKSDLMAGFAEFFERMTREEREQVWGMTFPLAKTADDPSPLSRFDEEYDGLLQRLNDRSVELLQQEVDHRRRGLIYGFPQQVESLRTVAKDFLGEIFLDSAYEERQMLRGVYFTSGTQEGTPIDRLMRTMAQAFGIGRQAVGTGQGTGKSFFLTRLLEGVIFNEAGLVSADDAVERRYKWILRGSIAASFVAVAVAATLWTVSYLGNAALVAEARADIDEYRQSVASIQVNPVEDIDIDRVVPALNILRDMPGNPAYNEPDPETSLTWGLYQGDTIGTEAAQTYRGALNQLLLPRLLLRLEKQMQSNFNNADLLYPALKVYLMLGLQGPIDEDLVRTWLTIDWNLTFPGGSNQPLRQDLAVHLDQLLSQPMEELPLNGNLVEAVRDILTVLPLEERIYQSIIESPEAKAVPDWQVRTAGGPMSARVLVRPSGAPLTDGVEGIFTYRGFTEVFLDQAVNVPDRLRREAWVLGDRAEALDDARLADLTQNVLELYYDDYVDRWNRVLADISIIPPNSKADAARIVGLLSGASSPIRNILESAAEETELTRVPEGADGDFDAAGAASEAGDVVSGQFIRGLDDTTRRLLDVVSGGNQVGGGGGGQAEQPEPFGYFVEQRFAWLHEMVESEGDAPSPLDDYISMMQEVADELRIQPTSGVIAPPSDGGAIGRLRSAAQTLEEAGPLETWVSQVVQGAGEVERAGTRSDLNKIWSSQVLPVCERTLAGRYPFDRGAQADVTLQDFQRVFAPDGLIDAFFKQHLIDYVDTTTKPWRWKSVLGADLGISSSVLTQFQHAADIRDSFFLSGGPPKVTFDLKPVALDSKATSVTLEIEGQVLEYAHQVPQVTPMKWPGDAGGRTRVAFTPQLPNAENAMTREGPWAWFRLLDSAELRRTNVSDRSKVIFNVGGRIAVFEMRAGSALNPFSLPALRSFRCIKSL